VRWQGDWGFATAGTYKFTVTADDGIRLYVDGNLLIDQWKDQGPTTYTAQANMPVGTHRIKTEFYENGGGATAQLTWQLVSASDTTAPTVSLTAPAGGATVSGTVTVSATAGDNVGVAGVQFKLDGVNLGTEDTTSPYSVSWDTTAATNGSHTLTAEARDAAGNSAPSSSVTVTVSNAPLPAPGQAFQESGGLVVMEAEHADTLTAPMQRAADTTASGGEYIVVPNGAGTAGMATYSVNITNPGTYLLWGRTIAPSGEDDSFFVAIDQSGDKLWDVAQSAAWQWDRTSDRGIADPVLFNLTTGLHTISVKQREDGTKLDKLILTRDTAFTPSGTGPAESPRGTGSPDTTAPVITFTSPKDGDIMVAP
jgi:hypothetical protein